MRQLRSYDVYRGPILIGRQLEETTKPGQIATTKHGKFANK